MRRIGCATAIVVWAASAAHAQWGAAHTIGNGMAMSAPAPRVVVDRNGNSAAVFSTFDAVQSMNFWQAVDGTGSGSWGAPQTLGAADDGLLDLAVDQTSGLVLAAWVEDGGAIIRTATRAPGGSWTIPGIGQPGTWVASGHVSNVFAAIGSDGEGAVAWAIDMPAPEVDLVLQTAGTWSTMPEVTPVSTLAVGGMVRDGAGNVLIVDDAGGFNTLRRRADGTYVPRSFGPAEGHLQSVVADEKAGTFLTALYFNGDFRVYDGTIASVPPNDTVPFRQTPAALPGLDARARAAALALRIGTTGETAVAWLDAGTGGLLQVATEHAGVATVDALAVDTPVDLGIGRTDGDDVVVVYDDGGAQPGVKSYVRTPCAAGAWSATPVTLDAGALLSPLRVAAGGNVAVAVWAAGNGQVKAAVFAGTAIPAGGVCAPPVCVSAAAVPSFTAGTLSLVDVQGGGTLRTIPVGAGPYGVAVNPVDDAVWVTNRESDSVSVLASGATAASTLAVPKKPLGIAFDATGTRAYVASYDDDQVAIVDVRTRTVLQTVKVGSGPSGVAVSPDGTTVWTANYGSNTVSSVDLTTTPPTVKTTRQVVLRPLGIAVSADGMRVYATGYKSNRVVVLDPAKPRRVKRIRVGRRPTGIAFAPAPSTALYVANSRSASVSVIDTATDRVVGRIPTGKQPYGVSIDPAGRYLFVVESGTSSVLMWDLTAGAVVRRIGVPGGTPVGLGDFLLRDAVCN